MKQFLLIFIFLLSALTGAEAANLDFTVNIGENVVVSGTPRLSLDIGGIARFATYNAGASSPSALVFRYAVQNGDFDANGVSISSPLDLNGGAINDLAGNALNPLTFTPPNTSGVLVQTYSVAWITTTINESNETVAGIRISNAPNGATYNYTITSSGGAGSVTGTGTISSSPQDITGINVSSLPNGNLTASVTITTGGGGTGSAVTALATGTSVTRILDSLPTAAAAYSVRRLITTYTGALIRVRRASDNLESDIGYNNFSGNLNTSALATFCGTSNCFITTWYNQVASPNAVQATATNQPQIYIGGSPGSVITLSARPALRWDASNDLLSVTGITWNAYTLSSVMVHNSVTMIKGLATKRSTGEFFWFIFTGNNLFWDQNGTSTPNRFDTAFLPSTGVRYVYTLVRPLTGANRIQYVNGSAMGSSATNADVSNTQVLTIGNDPSNITTRSLDGQISEFIVFTTALGTTDRTALEGNQTAYYP